MIKDWRNAIDNKCAVGAVSMDLSKAFDIIPLYLLLAKLAAYGALQSACPSDTVTLETGPSVSGYKM